MLQRSETMPIPHEDKIENKTFKTVPYGKCYRSDLLDFRYKVMHDAGDYKNLMKIICLSLVMNENDMLRTMTIMSK